VTALLPFLAIVLTVAAVCDIRYRRIPNLLTYPMMAGGVVYHSFTNGTQGFLFGAGGLALGIVLLIVAYLIGGMGAGDVKLLGAVGSVLGPAGVFEAFVYSAVIGGIYAFAVIAWNGRLVATVKRYWIMLKTFFFTRRLFYVPPAESEKNTLLCYGVAIAIGTILYLTTQFPG
jgi:prepilin peptidase CpaA